MATHSIAAPVNERNNGPSVSEASSPDDGLVRDPRLLHAVDDDVFSLILGRCSQRDVVRLHVVAALTIFLFMSSAA